MKTSQRSISLLLALALCLSSLVCVLSLAEGAHHDCPGAACPVCARLRERTNSLREMGIPVLGALFLPRLMEYLLPMWKYRFRHETPVVLKVRLTN